jgi:hypothetical protein
MQLTTVQKQTAIEALKIYWQYVKSRLEPSQALPVIQDIKVIMKELETIEIVDVEDTRPVGVTDEQFENVCKKCDQYDHKCKDLVAMKFPGKCDPLLKYERSAKNGYIIQEPGQFIHAKQFLKELPESSVDADNL